MSDLIAVHIHTPSGLTIPLSFDEYRLALLGLVDFEGQWQALEAAAQFVTDGRNKAALIRERLLPIAGYLPVLVERDLDAAELLAVRFWFRQGTCRAEEAVDSQEGTS